MILPGIGAVTVRFNGCVHGSESVVGLSDMTSFFCRILALPLNDFPGQQDGDFPVRKDDRITILEQIDYDCLRGESNGMLDILTFIIIEIGDIYFLVKIIYFTGNFILAPVII